MTAALHHEVGVAISDILGGIALQTVVLAALDVGVPGKRPLTWQAASLMLVLEGVLVTAVLVVTMMGTQLPASLIRFRLTPEDLALAGLWLAGLWLLKKAARIAAVFAVASLVTLAAGVALEQSSDGIARHLHLTGVLYRGDNPRGGDFSAGPVYGHGVDQAGRLQLAISDIFGGNASLPVLFLAATALSGEAVLPQAQKTDIYLAGLVFGRSWRPAHCCLHLRPDLSPEPLVSANGYRFANRAHPVHCRRGRAVRNFRLTLTSA